jgi:signal transduction histidine kinase
MSVFSVALIIGFAAALFVCGKKFAYKAMLPIEEAIFRQRQFIADASHELRTPLSVILAGTELIKTDGRQKLSAENKKILQDVQEEIRKMAKLVQSLIRLSKIDENGVVIRKEEDVAQIAALAVNTLRPLAEKKKIKLSLVSEEPILWYTNNEVLAQIIYILLDNAIKYTPEGGQVLAMLKVDAQKEKKLTLTVEDSGIGIPESEQTRIFERFYRIDKTRSRKEGGSGLGLAILAALLEKHGGTVAVSSKLGKGSSFKVTLPEARR